jgi:alpha-N-arabinofuranosidase
MCELLGTEPYLAGNVGSGSVQELADWVQYVNFAGKSNVETSQGEWTDKPWNVRLWGVGNEAWGCGGNMQPAYYADTYRKYATFMTDWTNGGGVFRIASGANSADYNWTETLMKNIPTNMLGGIALHHYSVINWAQKGPDVDFTEEQYFATMQSALFMDSLIIKHVAIMDKYDTRKTVALVVDEWGGWYEVQKGTYPGFLYQQNTMRDAMIAGATLNIFNNHADRVKIANLAQSINVLQAVILTEKEKMILTPTYHVMEMYNVHQDATLLPLTLKSNDYVLGKGTLPAVSASASKDTLGVTHISLVNIDARKEQQITIDATGLNFKSLTGKILASKKLQDMNTFDNPKKLNLQHLTGQL